MSDKKNRKVHIDRTSLFVQCVLNGQSPTTENMETNKRSLIEGDKEVVLQEY